MTDHFRSAIVRQTLTGKGRELLHLAREAFQRILGRTATHAAQHHEPRLALDQRADAGAIECAFDQIAFLMTRAIGVFRFAQGDG